MKPGLSAIILKENVEELEGVSLKNVGLKCYLNKKLIYDDIGEMIFTRKGISGPLVLTLSSILCNKNGDIKISIDLKPGLTDQKLDDRILRSFDFTYVSNEKLDYAIISVGGVDVNEIDPSTMESKIVKDLYFCGEVIDVDGFTGGFNLQFAFSTGYLAGINI